MDKVATRLKRLSDWPNAFVYRLSSPLRDHQYVVVSAVNNQFAHETYIFGADSAGKVADWSELPGSFQGATDHSAALKRAGYEVAS